VVTHSALDACTLEAALAALPKPKKGKVDKPVARKHGLSREALERVAKLERKVAENDAAERERLTDIVKRRAALDAEETEARGLAAKRRRELDEKLAVARAALETEN
jgi:Skp family chaperone for outer membrane proteins